MKKVLYLHGLESKQGGSKVDFLSSICLVSAPVLDYRDSACFQNIHDLVVTNSFDLIIGSSMGGLATLYALSLHPEKFTTALSLSPHWILSDEKFVEKMIAAIPDPGSHKVWMSIGTKGLDSDYLPLHRLADQAIIKKGYNRSDFVSKVYKRSGHNERSWARYLDEPMSFWLTS